MGEEGSSIDDIFIYFIFLTPVLVVLDAVVGWSIKCFLDEVLE